MNNDSINSLSLILQLIGLEILFRDYNNGDLMSELQRQDEIYLKKIIEQNEEVLNLLKKGEQDGRKVNRKGQ